MQGFCRFIISTHTLTWSVTEIEALKKTEMPISTHTLTWSVTPWCRICFGATNFNSHAHVERDVANHRIEDLERISTHTLTWSVT